MSLQNIRIKSATQSFQDSLIEKYGNKKNVEEIINLTFNKEVMHDFDVVPSFSPGSKSYYARIKDWEMLDFVVARLLEIPESNKSNHEFCTAGILPKSIRKTERRLFTLYNHSSVSAY